MSRTVEGRGQTLEAALATAVRQLLDSDEVEVRVDGASADGFAGRARIDVEVVEADEPVEPRLDDAETPTSAEPEAESASSETDEGGGTDVVSAEELDEEADAAADFLEGLLDALDLPGDLRIKLQGDHVELEIIEIGSGALIGRRGQTLDAIQELVRCSLQRQFQRRSRVKIDAEGYRTRRLEKLLEKAEEAIDDVLETGEAERLEPMDVFERKAVHQLVADVDGLSSRSQGREPARRVIIERE